MPKKIKPVNSLTENAARLYEIAVLAVSDLGGGQRAIDTEDIAIRCHELAPSLFSWSKYPQQVNLEIVRVSLSDAKKQKNGQLLAGSGREGWRLTPRGLDWLAHIGHSKRIAGRAVLSKRTAGSIDTVRAAREAARIEAMPAWTKWKAGHSLDASEALAVFRIDGYTSGDLLEIKLTRLIDLFRADSDHRRFLELVSTLLPDREK